MSECKKSKILLGKDKIYEFKNWLGFKTDTRYMEFLKKGKVLILIINFINKIPVYSSKTLNEGITKPLRWEKKVLKIL